MRFSLLRLFGVVTVVGLFFGAWSLGYRFGYEDGIGNRQAIYDAGREDGFRVAKWQFSPPGQSPDRPAQPR
jgi:hypothetical protein